MTGLIFHTVTGSRLYGLSHEGSDYDEFFVFGDNRPWNQSVKGKEDVTTVGILTLLKAAQKGSPQALEVIFSQKKTWLDTSFAPLLAGYRAADPVVFSVYARTVKKFAFSEVLKQRRHAVRVYLNLLSLRACGTFDPTLTASEAEFVRSLGELQGAALLDALSPIIIEPSSQ